MPKLNLDVHALAYEDENNQSSSDPKVKIFDINECIAGAGVDLDKNSRCAVYPNDIKDVATTKRGVLWDLSTELSFARPVSTVDYVRITHTGTGSAPSFRVDRVIGGDATTEVTITRVTDHVARITNTGGGLWDLSSVAVNDIIKFDKEVDGVTNPLSASNKGREYLVQAKGVDYIDFIDNGFSGAETVVLGADFEKLIRVMSQSPVKKGDTIYIKGAGVNPSNHGKFLVEDVSTDFIEIVNPLGVNEVITYGTNNIVVYEYLIGFMILRASAPIKVKFDAQEEWTSLDRVGGKVMAIGTFSAHSIQVLNDSPSTVTVSVQHLKASGV